MQTVVLDTSVLLGGYAPPVGARVITSPEARAEIAPGGRSGRRMEQYEAAGLLVVAADAEAAKRVQEAADRSGQDHRLSAADQSLIALALQEAGTLWSDDKTILDLAGRLGVKTFSPSGPGLTEAIDWQPRCQGCGRWFDGMPEREECPICGSQVRARKRTNG